jgi:hypothetical protein
MNAVHPIMAAALRPFAPRPTPTAEEQLASLLRLPFQVEVQNAPATRYSEPQYVLVTIDEDLVREAADWLIDKHIDELERKALELQRARWDEHREDV